MPELPDPDAHAFFDEPAVEADDQDPTLASGGDPEVYEEGVESVTFEVPNADA